MPKRRKSATLPVRPKFKVADRVRVRHGVRDDDYPDIPLGGWTGTVTQRHVSGMLCVRWSRETLASIHPIYKKRCAIDGADLNEYWIEANDLEPDPGGRLSIEQPTSITPRPLSENEPGDRVRAIFGLTSDDFLSDSDEESLETYCDFLVKRLSLPFEAKHDTWGENPLRRPLTRRVDVIALDRETAWDEDEGILGRVRTAEGEDVVALSDLRLCRTDPNYQLVADYVAWFFGDLCEELDDEFNDDDDFGTREGDDYDDDEDAPSVEVSELLQQMIERGMPLIFLEAIALAAGFGAVVGSAVAVMPWARWGACIGCGLWGMLVMVVRMTQPSDDTRFVVPRIERAANIIVGLGGGIFLGTLFGVMAVGFIGAISGGVVGLVLSRFFRGRKLPKLYFFPNPVLVAAGCGVIAQAFYINRAEAIVGLWHGALIASAVLVIGSVVVPAGQWYFRKASR